MTFDYFYGEQAEQFSFYRVPKVLFTNKAFADVSCEAKLLYGILLDRMNLSAKNGWSDASGRVYIIFTIEEVREAICCSDKKALKMLDELERKCRLIERKRQGLGKPNLIYVKNFIPSDSDGTFLNRKKDDSGDVQNTIPETSEIRGINTYQNNTESIDTDSFLFTSFSSGGKPERKRYDAKDREGYRELIKENIEYEILLTDKNMDIGMLDEIIEIMVDVVCTNREYLHVNKDDVSAETVRSQFLKLDAEHIRFVMDCLKKNTTQVRNTKQYIITTLYNAPLTIQTYFTQLVSHDMAEGLI